ncbi:MAG: hypothetical protein K2M56_00880 [Muribaculaceae bacterium]|nr:hypothetical protein [Muribaculaceae bacterium]
MNQTISMGYSPAIRASRALRSLNVRRMCVRAIAPARRFSLALAIIFTVISYVGILFGSEIINCLAATVALGFVCLADSTQKGGEE